MTKKIINIFSILLLSIILCSLFSCDGDVVSPDTIQAPIDIKVIKLNNAELRLSWSYFSGSDTLVFRIAKKIGTGDWDLDYYYTINNFLNDPIALPTNEVNVYKIQVQNISNGKESDYSDQIPYFPENIEPSDLKMYITSSDSVLVNWIDNCVGEDGFRVDKKVGNNSWEEEYQILLPNTTYFYDTTVFGDSVHYRVSAFVGDTYTEKVENSLLITLPAPTNLELKKLDVSTIKLEWEDNSNEDGFYVDRKVGDVDWTINYAVINKDVTYFIDNINKPCGTFQYRVRAYKESYSSFSSNIDTINVRLNLVGSLNTVGEASKIFINDWRAYLTDQYGGLHELDYSNPTSLSIVKTLNLPDRTLAVYVKDNLAYVTNHRGGIHIVDLNSFSVINESRTCGIPADIVVNNVPPRAYIADSDSGMTIISLSSSTPTIISNFIPANVVPGEQANCIYVKDNYSYLAYNSRGMVIVDISDVENPVLGSELKNIGIVKNLDIQGNYAFLANGDDGVAIVDISSPTAPNLIARCNTGGYVYDLKVDGDYVYVTDKEKGFLVVDISNVNSPYVLGNYEMSKTPNSIAITDSYGFVTDNDGLKIIQVNP